MIGANLIILLIVDFHMLYYHQENLTSPGLLLAILTIYSFSKVLKLFHLFLIYLNGELTFSIRSLQDYLLGCYFIIFIYAPFVMIDLFIFIFKVGSCPAFRINYCKLFLKFQVARNSLFIMTMLFCPFTNILAMSESEYLWVSAFWSLY